MGNPDFLSNSQPTTMDIITNKIQLAVTDEEANVLLSAVSRFRGIYENTELKHPDDISRQERSIKVAGLIRDALEAELLERYHNAMAGSED